MSESGFDAKFFEQFLDDYFAEADEHLRSVQRNLLNLEDELAAGQRIEKTAFNELFRSFHTLKGISAMAGVPAAETLAHHTESYLRLLRDGETAISREGLLALIRSTQKLEKIVAAKRHNTSDPDFGMELALLETLISRKEPDAVTFAFAASPVSAPDTDGDSDGDSDRTTATYLFTFVSSAALAERNVNVNTVRGRLSEIGTIVKSTPTVLGGGQVAFEFLVETAAGPELFDSWSQDGIRYAIAFGGPTVAVIESPATDGDSTTAVTSAPSFVRVDLSRLDGLMLMVGELVISRAKLADHIKSVERVLPAEAFNRLEETNHAFENQLRNLRDGVMRVRMTPIGEVFERLRFAVRDLARESGKQIDLEMSGANTEIDKLLVEKVLDPLLHLVRNAVSHGIEPKSERLAKRKPEHGTIRLHAATAGEAMVLEIEDDGAGIALEKVAERARQLGMIDKGEQPDEKTLLGILCSPGFSTRTEADKASGRGVGMDVVRQAIDELGGTFSFETTQDVGTKFRIELPLTLAIADALIVAVDNERYAVPQLGVREVIEVRQGAVRRLENNEIIEYRGGALPLVRLSRLFGLKETYRDVFHAFVVGEGQAAVGIAVDRVLGQSEIVIRAMNDPFTRIPGISGATELGDGRIILILDPAVIARRLEEYI